MYAILLKQGFPLVNQNGVAITGEAFKWENILGNAVAVFPRQPYGINYYFVEFVWAVTVEMAFYLTVFIAFALTRQFAEHAQ